MKPRSSHSGINLFIESKWQSICICCVQGKKKKVVAEGDYCQQAIKQAGLLKWTTSAGGQQWSITRSSQDDLQYEHRSKSTRAS